MPKAWTNFDLRDDARATAAAWALELESPSKCSSTINVMSAIEAFMDR